MELLLQLKQGEQMLLQCFNCFPTPREGSS